MFQNPVTDRPGRSHILRGWNMGWRAIGRLAIISGSLALALVVYFGLIGSEWVDEVAEWTARWTSTGLNLFGYSTTANGTILSSGDFAVNIVAECTAVGPLVLFIGAVFAYPTALRAKGLGVLIGIVVLTSVNVVRIMSLFWIGLTYPQYLSLAHLIVWQSVIILLAIVLWLFWVERVADARGR